MSDDGGQKEDVKVPEGDAGDKIKKLFTDDGKDVSKLFAYISHKIFLELTRSTDVIVMAAMGEEYAIDAKEAPKG